MLNCCFYLPSCRRLQSFYKLIIYKYPGFLVYILHNKNRVSIKRSVRAIYNTLLSDDKFISFGTNKVIITSVLVLLYFNYSKIIYLKTNSLDFV